MIWLKCLNCSSSAKLGEVFCNNCEIATAALFYPRSCYDAKSQRVAAFRYDGPIATLIKRAKGQHFGIWDEQLRKFFERLIQHWSPALAESAPNMIVAVPGNPLRCELETDLALHCALELAKKLKAPISPRPLLRRRILDKELLHLNNNPGRELRILRGQALFEISKDAKDYAPRKILLVDDVMATGASLNRCQALLEECGHTVCQAFVLARS